MASGSATEISSVDGTKTEFRHFDVVSDVSDHIYRNNNQTGKETCFSNANGAVYKKIMREWKILKGNLPDNIYVRAYETRIDLLRAVIIGASGTPYHDGLFFFDILFPMDYPNNPPTVYYHSRGLRLNPNLYANGKVCLSLLNTWSGAKSEKWTPSTSTILQVLVSIQGLVLNNEPFFNEPLVDFWIVKVLDSQTKRSIAYNEEAFIKSCQTLLYNVRNPPKNFESFVKEYFESRGEFIMGAIEAYMNGRCTVGTYIGDGSSSSKRAKVSAKFKVKARGLYKEYEAILKPKIVPSLTIKKRQENVIMPSVNVAEQRSEKRDEVILEKPKIKRGAWKKIISSFKCISI